ncbi:MAG: IbrB-like domain-containing protein [Clostridia bacterium]
MEKSYLSPVYNILRVPVEKIQANEYNPNHVAPPEMKLLYKSIKEDGYTMPIVCYYIKENDTYEIVDGFHRYLIIKTHKDIYEREKGCLPVSVIDKDISNRMASTIRHNRARGEHSIDLMVNIVKELLESGMSDSWIMRNIGMDADELLRLKQISGLASLFKEKDFTYLEERDGK